jgi:hypothetical protein
MCSTNCEDVIFERWIINESESVDTFFFCVVEGCVAGGGTWSNVHSQVLEVPMEQYLHNYWDKSFFLF